MQCTNLCKLYSSDLVDVSDDEETTSPLLIIDTAGCDLYELDLPEEVSKGNEGYNMNFTFFVFTFDFCPSCVLCSGEMCVTVYC